MPMLSTIGGGSAKGFWLTLQTLAGLPLPNWTGPVTETKIAASDGQVSDFFGAAVDIAKDADFVIVGAQLEDGGSGDPKSNAGTAYIFTKSGSSWSQQAKLIASDAAASDQFGVSVAINSDGTYAVMGAQFEDGGAGDPITQAGAGYVFVRSGSTWTEQAKLVASDAAASDTLGSTSAMDDDGVYVAIGTSANDNYTGSVYIFTRSGSTWSQQANLTASDAQTGDLFSYVSFNSDASYIICGADGEDTNGGNAGAAYIFTRSGSSWSEQQKITASDAAAGDLFGNYVAMDADGDTVIVGARMDNTRTGAAYIFTRSGSTWTEQAKLTASDAAQQDRFGTFVGLSDNGDYAFVGSELDAGGGSLYVFERSGSSWSQIKQLQASDREQGDALGNAIAVNNIGNIIIAGAKGEDGGSGNPASGQGAAYIYEVPFEGASSIGSVSHNQAFTSHSSTQISTTATLNSGYTDRQIWVVVPTMSITGGGTTGATSATIGGNAMTLHRRVNQTSNTNSVGIAWFKYTDNGALGTSASVVVNFGYNQVHSGLIVFDSTEATVETDFYGVEGAGNLADGAISTSSSGWSAYCSITQNGSSGTQNDFGNILSFDVGTNEWVVFGYNSPASGGSQTIIDDPTGFAASRNAFCGLAMEP